MAGGRLRVTRVRVPVDDGRRRRGGGGGGHGGRLAVLFHRDSGRGHDGRARRRGRHEIATGAAAGRLPAAVPVMVVVPLGRVRVEHRGPPVTLAETPVRVMGGEYAAERVPELRVEYRVDDRVERRVGVAEPREHFERGLGYARLAERRDDVHAEERHPAQQERAHYDADRYGGLVIAHVIRRRVVMELALLVLTVLVPAVIVMDGRRQRGGRRRDGRRARGGQRPRHRPDALHVLLRVTVQPAIDADHHHARYVETDARRYDRVRGRQVQRARHVLGVSRVEHHRLGRPVDAQYAYGHDGNERGQRPYASDAQQRIPTVQIRRVPARTINKNKKNVLNNIFKFGLKKKNRRVLGKSFPRSILFQ